MKVKKKSHRQIQLDNKLRKRAVREKQKEEMGKKTLPNRGASRQQRTLRHGVHIELMMECIEEGLSQSQHDAFRKADQEYKNAMARIRDANRREKEGTAIVIMQTRHGMPIPPAPLAAVHPQPQQPATKLVPLHQNQPQKPAAKQPSRSDSPDLIIIGETPPPKKPTPAQKPTPPQARPQVVTQPPQPQVQAQPTRVVTTTGTVLRNVVPQQVYKFVNVQGQPIQGIQQPQLLSVMKPVAPVVPQQQNVNSRPLLRMQYVTSQPVNANNKRDIGPKANEIVMGTHGLGIKRVSEEDSGPAKKKKKPVETDESGNWVPLDEYYYGKKEGDPTYTEEKGEYRFKCWYCSKMLYNNVKAMMHLQGHIDSGRQHNLDLTDLTQCKHCYKQFDTPFEMQTHVEKVHMSNTNVLMCRICERDLDSRQSLTSHMRQNHNACEMPYLCQLCNFRSSMYSDVVDHFKKKHDSSQNILCLYCLRVFKVKFVSQGWGQTQTYYGHLLKHQSKTSAKKCNLCRLTFFNPADVKAHKKKDHLPNHKGIQGTGKHTSPGQVMIKVPESGLHVKQQNLKSLNAPAVSKVLDFGGTKLPVLVNYLTCLECKTSMGTPDHFKKHIECSMCRFATSCSIAYANHMMGFHSGQMSSLNLNIPWERKMKYRLYCLCGYGSRYGNNIANHLVFCAKRTCYLQKPDIIPDDSISDEDVDPRHKPGASLLDVLGLVKKRTVSTKDNVDKDVETEKVNEIRRRTRENSPPPKSPPPSVRRKPRDITPPPKSPVETTEENIPEELTGAQKWNTVKIKDTKEPSKASVFLGISDDVKESEPDSAIATEEEESGKDALKEPEVVDNEDNMTIKDSVSKSDECAMDVDGAESVIEQDNKSDEQKLDDSLLNRTEDEPDEDDVDYESKLNDSVLDQQDSDRDDSKSEASEKKSEIEEKSESVTDESHVEQSASASSEKCDKINDDDIKKASEGNSEISSENNESVEGQKEVSNIKSPSVNIDDGDEKSENPESIVDQSVSQEESENEIQEKEVLEQEVSGNKETSSETVTEEQPDENDEEQEQRESQLKESSEESTKGVEEVTEGNNKELEKEDLHLEESDRHDTVGEMDGEDTEATEKTEDDKLNKIESDRGDNISADKGDNSSAESGDNSSADNKKLPEDIELNELKSDPQKGTEVPSSSSEDKKTSSVEKEYSNKRDRSRSKERNYEEKQEYGSQSKHHGGRSYDHRQDHHRSSEGHRHGDRSHDRDYYRDRDQYRDGDRYHDRNYHGHRDDRNYNRHGGGYHSNQSHGSGRWDDRRDDYRNRHRDYDRYNRGGRGGYGYGGGYHSNYR